MSGDRDHNLPDPLSERFPEAATQVPIVTTAYRFLHHFYTQGDLAAAWMDVDPLLQMCWSQWWTHANEQALTAEGYEVEEAATELARNADAHPLWRDFQRVILRDFRAAHPLNVAKAGIGTTPRAIAPNVELLYVHRRVPEGGRWEPGASSSAVPVVLHLDGERWKVMNLGYERIPEPGWPPTLA